MRLRGWAGVGCDRAVTGAAVVDVGGGDRGRALDRDQVSVGVLISSLPREVVDAAIAAHGAGRRRSDGKLPPHVVVCLLMALWLFAGEDYEEVATKVTGYLDDLGCWAAPWSPPTASAITQARKRLPAAVMAQVFDDVAAPLASPWTPGAWLGTFPGRTRRLVAIDGFDLDIPDSDANAAAFGRAGHGGTNAAGSAFPKARVVTITECATHAPLAAAIGAWSVGEPTLARQLYPRLRSDEVLLADRGFYSYTAFTAAAATGADLIWRAPTGLGLPVIATLADGSYLSVLIPPGRRYGPTLARTYAAARAAAGSGAQPDPVTQGRLVRVVDYDVPERAGPSGGELVTLITTILAPDDPDGVPALAPAGAYAQRWEIETGFDAAKTHLRGPGQVLRSRLPELVTQEIWALLITHHAIAALATRAAEGRRGRPRQGLLRTHPAHHPPHRHRDGGFFPLSAGAARCPRRWPRSPPACCPRGDTEAVPEP